jgi:hypothetical protein
MEALWPNSFWRCIQYIYQFSAHMARFFLNHASPDGLAGQAETHKDYPPLYPRQGIG